MRARAVRTPSQCAGPLETLANTITLRFEAKGYKLCGLKQLTVDRAQAEKHYSDLSSKPFFGGEPKALA